MSDISPSIFPHEGSEGAPPRPSSLASNVRGKGVKQPRRRGRIISTQLPRDLIAQLDGLAADKGWDRSTAMQVAVRVLIAVKETVHVHVSTTPTPREASDLLAGRGRVRIPVRIAKGLAVEQAASDHVSNTCTRENMGERE